MQNFIIDVKPKQLIFDKIKEIKDKCDYLLRISATS